MVARDPADTPTEQFVPDFDDDVSDEEPDSLREPAGDAEPSENQEADAPAVSAEPGAVRCEHGESSDIAGTQAPRDTDPDDSDQPQDPSPAGRGVSGVPDESVNHGETPDTPPELEPSPDLAGLTARLAAPNLIRPAGPGHNGVVGGTVTAGAESVRVPGTVARSTGSAVGTALKGGSASADGGAVRGGAARTAGALAGLARAYRLIGWERAAAVGVLVLCTAVAGLLTGFAVVRATSDWTVTWGGTEQVDGRRPAPEESRSAPPPQFDRPRYPASTNSVSPTPSVSASAPGPTASARPSRSPKPPATPTPGVPPSGSPTATEPSPSPTGDPGNED